VHEVAGDGCIAERDLDGLRDRPAQRHRAPEAGDGSGGRCLQVRADAEPDDGKT
jgi:hypothetical protein